MNEGNKTGARPWLVLVGCCILCGIGFGVPMTVMSSFMKPMIVTLGVPATTVTLYFSVVMLASMASVVVGPRLLKKNTPVTVAVCGVVTGLSLLGIALGQSVAAVLVGAVLIGLTYPLCSTMTTSVVIANWFKKGSGTFLGVAMAFTGLGAAVLVPVAAGFIESAGWQRTLFVIGIAYAVVIVLTGAFLVRFAPREGQAAYGAAEAVARGGKKTGALSGVSYRDALRMPAFYLLAACLVLVGFMSCINTQISTIAQFSGFDAAAAAIIVSCMAVGNVAGKLVLGAIKDRSSGAVSGLFAGICVVAGIACFAAGIVGGIVPVMYVGSFICGLGSCLGTMAGPFYVMDAFGPREYGAILGTAMVFITLGNAIGSPVVNAIFDASGSYLGSLAVLLVATVALVPLGFAAVRGGQKAWKDEGASAELAEEA